MVGVGGDDDFHIVHQTFQHAELGVRLKAGQHARGVVVVEELASEFQIEFAAELRDALSDVGGLQLDVFFVVESLAHRGRHPFPNDVVNGKIIPDVVGNKNGFPDGESHSSIESNYSRGMLNRGLHGSQKRAGRNVADDACARRVCTGGFAVISQTVRC